jgi:hypothetical protein
MFRILAVSSNTFLRTDGTYVAQHTTSHPGSQQKDRVNNYYSTAQHSTVQYNNERLNCDDLFLKK